VILDLKGFTLTGPGASSLAINISNLSGDVVNTYPMTVQNGTITNFQHGLHAGQFLTDITINNIVFFVNQNTGSYGDGIIFTRVSSSTISNCTISGGSNSGSPTYGIEDIFILGGNNYKNDKFLNMNFQLFTQTDSSPVTFDRCQFAPPPTP
jgi:hypothetical protein